jgi:hypothetical protein
MVIDQIVLIPESPSVQKEKIKHWLIEAKKDLEREYQHSKQYRHEYWLKQRNAVIEMLGGKCVYCGISDLRVLQIDHINGGGGKEIRKYGPRRYKIYLARKCIGLQLLCANCNAIKKYENNEVPTRRRENASPY